MGKSTLEIEAKSGIVKSIETPWYMPFILLRKKTIKLVEYLKNNFDNENVEKKFLSISGFTETGIQKFRQAQ